MTFISKTAFKTRTTAPAATATRIIIFAIVVVVAHESVRRLCVVCHKL